MFVFLYHQVFDNFEEKPYGSIKNEILTVIKDHGTI